MNPTQKQFSLNRGASRKQIPISFNRLGLSVLVILLALGAALPSAQAATLTVTPSSVSNLFSGTITLAISGLTNTEPVLVEKFVDFNGNGAVDAGDMLVESFKLTEGQVTRIGGVRNLNVPGDDDGVTNAAISTVLNFVLTSQGNSFDRFIGTYVFRVSSPSSRFAPVLKPFTVTNTPFTPTITGNVPGGMYSAVVLLEQSGNDTKLVAGAYTDAAGNFTLKHRPGTYQLLAARPGSVTDFSTGALIVLSEGSSTNVTVPVTATTQTISGQLRDSVSLEPLPGVLVNGFSTNNQFSLTYADATGNYSLAATDGQWGVEVDEQALGRLGYLRLSSSGQNNEIPVVVNGGSVVTNIALHKATALISGSLRDASNNPIPGIEISANGSSQYSANGLTDAAGNYSLGILAGMWNVSPSTESGLLVNGTNVTVAAGQAVQANFVTPAITARLMGVVRNELGQSLANFPLALANFPLVVQPAPVSGGGANSFYPFTDASGNFDIGLYGGNWHLALECQQASSANLVSFTKDFTVVDNVNQSGIVLIALTSTRQITGTVRGTNGVGVSNIRVFANTTINGTNYVTGCNATDGTGSFLLKVVSGTWTVGLDSYALNQTGFVGTTNQTVVIGGANGNASFTVSRFSEFRPMFGMPNLFNGLTPNFSASATGGASGAYYRVESTTNFTNWAVVGTNYVNNGTFSIYDPSANGPFRFYRALLLTNAFGQGGGAP